MKNEMSRVTIYRYKVLDTNVVEPRVARRWGTRAAIASLGWADMLENTATEVDASVLNPGGFTPLDSTRGHHDRQAPPILVSDVVGRDNVQRPKQRSGNG
jgi:hypothetical protein